MFNQKVLLPTLFLFLLANSPVAQSEPAKRLVFFDVFVSEELPDVQKSADLFSRVLANEIVRVREYQVMDQGTRDTLLLQRKFNLADCAKSECRFAMAKALPGIEFMLETEIEPLGSSCILTMRVKSLKTGSILASQMEESECDPVKLLTAVRTAASSMFGEPAEEGKRTRQSNSSSGDGLSLEPGKAHQVSSKELKNLRSSLVQGVMLRTRFTDKWKVSVITENGDYECTVTIEYACVIPGVRGEFTVTTASPDTGTKRFRSGSGLNELELQESPGWMFTLLGGGFFVGGFALAALAGEAESAGEDSTLYTLGAGVGIVGGSLLGVLGIPLIGKAPIWNTKDSTLTELSATPTPSTFALGVNDHVPFSLAPAVGAKEGVLITGFVASF